MGVASTKHTAVIIPNWNGRDYIEACLNSLLNQTVPCEIVVVENGSIDGSEDLIANKYPTVTLLKQSENLGFAEGVNQGIRYAISNGFKYAALFNNDATADRSWVEKLESTITPDESIGIATSRLMNDADSIDSTGECYTTWGLPYPRGRNGKSISKFDSGTMIFGASGGASLYRVDMLREIGLFDKDFFAYYEDVDISFRAQLAGWKVRYVPEAIAYHKIGQTSGKIKGFTTYQTIKNLPWVLWKNVPLQLLPVVLPRFTLAYLSFIFSALSRGQFVSVAKGLFMSTLFLPKKTYERNKIHKQRTVSIDYIKSILVWDLPPNATRLRAVRKRWWRLKGKLS